MTSIYIAPGIQAVRDLHANVLSQDLFLDSIRDRLATQAANIVEGHRAGNTAVVFHLQSWCPGLVGAGEREIMESRVSTELARESIAREYGYQNWTEVEELSNTYLDAAFENAVDAVISGELASLEEMIRIRPSLITQCSQYGHRATLLHYLGANGVESYRQVTPLNAAEIAHCLIEAGSDINASARMYGGSTPLALVATSAHPHNAGVASAIIDVFRNAGADGT